MAEMDSEFVSQDEVESPFQPENQPQNNGGSLLSRQTSIFTLTLDEVQNTLCDGKTFGSMNMDEFLNSIWSAEENQPQVQVSNNLDTENATDAQFSMNQVPTERLIERQPSLQRQGSFMLPPPLSRKTVEEVWSEINRNQQDHQQLADSTSIHDPESSQRHATFGEMTLEDFLVKAGVVREQCGTPLLAQQPYGLYQTSNGTAIVGPGYVSAPVISMGGGGVNMPPYAMSPGCMGEMSGYAMNGNRSTGYPPHPMAMRYGGRVGNGAVGYEQGLAPSPASPVSSDGMCAAIPTDNMNQYAMDMAAIRGGRKRIIDGPVEKVVERRQRRMIKNRESAARSRARKQAYTVELEAELNQLKEDNTQLRHALIELDAKGKQQNLDEEKMRTESNAKKMRERMKALGRHWSCQF